MRHRSDAFASLDPETQGGVSGSLTGSTFRSTNDVIYPLNEEGSDPMPSSTLKGPDSSAMQTVGKDASIAPSTLERGIERHQARRTTRKKAESPPRIAHTKIHPSVWEVISPLVREGRHIKVYSATDVLVLNHPANQTEWATEPGRME